jgi:hypothetical protein
MWWEILLAVVLPFIFLIIAINLISKRIQNNKLELIKESINELFPDAEIKNYPYKNFYHLEIVEEEKTTLIKVIFARDDYEFIITNTNLWTINIDPRQWNRKTRPIFIEDAKEFTEHNKSGENIRKIVCLHPGTKRIIRYLNESDTVIVKPEDIYKGINFMNYNELREFLIK